jgi:septal ring factor EnvC (AmiA/AmiB activator)
MSPLISSPTFLFHRSTTLSNDVEMLQTDVMRFFAILCLCLMAIFALVKALPMSPPADRPTIVEPPNLNAEAASLQKEIAVLKDKLAKTQSQLTAATAAVEKSADQAAGAAAIEQRTMSRLSKARKELAMASQSLKEARNEIKEREAMVARIVKNIKDKRRIRSELKAQIKNETRNFEKIQAALDQITAKLNRPLQQKQQIPGNTPPAPVPRQPAKKGFTLRFASDTALETLISRKKVHFFALAGQKTWQLKLAHGRPVYIAVKIPSKIYEMETTTVPANYAAVFSRQVAAFGRGTVTWGVTLPDQTAASINRLIKDRDGGDLIIMPDGEVILN